MLVQIKEVGAFIFLYPLPTGLPLCVTIKGISLLQPVVKYWCFSLLGFALAPVRFGMSCLVKNIWRHSVSYIC